MALNFGNGGGGNNFFEAMQGVSLKTPEQIKEEARQLRMKQTNNYLNDVQQEFSKKDLGLEGGLRAFGEGKVWFDIPDSPLGNMTEEYNNYKQLAGEDASFTEFAAMWKQNENNYYSGMINSVNNYVSEKMAMGVDRDDIVETLAHPQYREFVTKAAMVAPEAFKLLEVKSTAPQKSFFGSLFTNTDVATGENSLDIPATVAGGAAVTTAAGLGYEYGHAGPKREFIKAEIKALTDKYTADKAAHDKSLSSNKAARGSWREKLDKIDPKKREAWAKKNPQPKIYRGKSPVKRSKATLLKQATAKYGKQVSKFSKVAPTAAFMAPQLGRYVGESLGGEEGAFAGQALGTGTFLGFLAKKLPKQAAKFLAKSGARHAALGGTGAGMHPLAQATLLLGEVGIAGSEVYSLYQEWKKLQSK